MAFEAVEVDVFFLRKCVKENKRGKNSYGPQIIRKR